MSDNFVLYGPGGASPVNLASWVDLSAGGPDFGARGLEQAAVADSALADSGRLAYTFSAPRRMAFPLVVPSGPAGGLLAAESLLRAAARPGAYLDLQPEGVPSAEAVRFDVIAGRWEPGYETRIHAAARRRGVLELDTQPFGYWPTWITVASWGNTSTGSQMRVAGFVGDVPAETRMQVLVQQAASAVIPNTDQVPVAGTWMTELLVPTFKRQASFAPLLMQGAVSPNAPIANGGSWFSDTTFSRTLAATYNRYPLTAGDSWSRVLYWQIFQSGGAVSYHQRFRVFGWVRQTASTGFPVRVVVDALDNSSDAFAMASSNQVATVVPGAASGVGGVGAFGAIPSSMWQVVDLGELSFPRNPAASGAISNHYLRVWANAGPSQIATVPIDVLGFYLHPAEQGYIGEGLNLPTVGAVTAASWAQFQTDTLRRAVEVTPFAGATSMPPIEAHDRWAQWRGALPRVTASDSAVSFMMAGRRVNAAATAPYGHQGFLWTSGRIEIRPRFLFLKGI